MHSTKSLSYAYHTYTIDYRIDYSSLYIAINTLYYIIILIYILYDTISLLEIFKTPATVLYYNIIQMFILSVYNTNFKKNLIFFNI